jgi:hypothetical protein
MYVQLIELKQVTPSHERGFALCCREMPGNANLERQRQPLNLMA